MSDTSKIEWTDATWNPVTGCSKVSQGCKNCYALRDWARLSANPKSVYYGRAFTDVRCHPERLDQPLRWSKPRRIFVNSMSDLFHEDVPDEFILQVFDVMRQCRNGYATELDRLVPAHTFQILTKRPERMLDFCGRLRFHDRCVLATHSSTLLNPLVSMKKIWLGTSVEDQATADERIPLLLQTPADVRFISAEPLLGPINLEAYLSVYDHHGEPSGPRCNADGSDALGWVIAGGESGPKARPTHPDWIRSLRDQCAAAGVAFFFKQWGAWAPCHIDVNADERGTELHPMEETVLDAMDHERGYRVEEHHGHEFFKAGKKLAGRHLDGRTHDEYPA